MRAINPFTRNSNVILDLANAESSSSSAHTLELKGVDLKDSPTASYKKYNPENHLLLRILFKNIKERKNCFFGNLQIAKVFRTMKFNHTWIRPSLLLTLHQANLCGVSRDNQTSKIDLWICVEPIEI